MGTMKKRFLRTRYGSIAVRESEGDSPPVLLIPQNILGSESFWRQIAGEPGRRFRLIAFDFPGRGDSPKAANPKRIYSLAASVAIVRELSAVLDLHDPAVVGHGQGGHVALQAVAAGLKPRSLMLIDTPPLGDPPDLRAAFLAGGIEENPLRATLTEAQSNRAARLMAPPGMPVPPYFARSIEATDPMARESMGTSVLEDGGRDELALLASLKVPVAVLMGEFDGIVNMEYVRAVRIPALWRDAVQVIAGAGHCPQYDAPLAFNPVFMDFLRETGQGPAPRPASAG